MLLITGIGANLDMWAPLERLLPGRELVAFDAPGVGLSQRPPRPLRMGSLARIVRELMDVLALERADVLGYSFGGALAQELARRAPERVRRLVLCATGPGLGGMPPKPMAALMLASPARYYHPRLLELSIPHIAGGRTARDRSVLAEHAGARLAHPPDVLGYAYQLYAAAGWTSLPWLRSLKHADAGRRRRRRPGRAGGQRPPARGPAPQRAAARHPGRRAPVPARRARARRRRDRRVPRRALVTTSQTARPKT